MAEENNQDMAMEDILSSIKNILEEDQVNNQSFANDIPMADDVLELSQDMRLPNMNVSPQELNLDTELDEVKIPELDETEKPHSIVNDDNSSLDITNDDLSTDPFLTDSHDSSISELLEDTDTNFVEDTAIPFDQTQMAQSEETENTNFNSSFESIETDVAQHQDTTDPFIEETFTDVVETVIQEEAIPETVETDIQEHLTPEVSTIENNDSAVDASANIISNFAKMFAKEEASAQQQVKPAPVENNINLLGDGSKTIEDVVCSVIRQIIADEVAANWQKSADYETFAKQEISSYTQKWMDKNLPAIVEKIVKQEIERVMAKAGNNQ